MAKGQEKLSRILKIISMLKTPYGRTISSMSEELEISERTIYRYIDTLEECGFPIDKSFGGERWFIVSSGESGKMLSFDVDEVNLLKDLVEQGAYNHPLKQTLLQKLYLNSELKPLTKNIIDARVNSIINKLKRAIKGEYKVILKSYHSISSNAIRDYLIEPHGFRENYQVIDAYDVNAALNKQFRTCRMGDVIVLEKKQTHIDRHSTNERDSFGFQGNDRVEIILKLNHTSATVMKELYKGTIDNLTPLEDYYIFQDIIHYIDGVGRFVLSQIDNVEIIKGEPIKNFVKEKLKVFNQKYFQKESILQ